MDLFQIKTDGTEDEKEKSIVEAVMSLVEKITDDTGADHCSVYCSIASTLLSSVIDNGHGECASRVADDIINAAAAKGQPPSKLH